MIPYELGVALMLAALAVYVTWDVRRATRKFDEDARRRERGE